MKSLQSAVNCAPQGWPRPRPHMSAVEHSLVFKAVGLNGGTEVVFLAHFEVFTEVLVTAPPIQVDHTESLVPAI